MTCLQCRLTLVNPDKNHRYCPYCGATRAIGADNDLLFCGEETLSSYKVYAYTGPNASPLELDPLKGPRDGSLWPRHDLVASSASPYPWSALRVLGPAAGGAAEQNLETPLRSARLRHRRLNLLTQNGQLISLHSQTLKQVAVREVGPAQAMHIAESLLHVTWPNGEATSWVAYPLHRTQESLFEQRLPLKDGELNVSFGAFAVLGEQDFLWGRLEAPERHHRARLPVSQAVGRSGVVRWGDDWIIVAADGKIHRQSATDPDPTEPEIIFANPNRLKVLQILTHGDEVVLLAQSPARQTTLIRIGAELVQRKLTVGSQEGEMRLTALPEGLFLAIKPVGGTIEIHRLGESEEKILSLPGSLEHELEGLYPLALDHGWALLLATKREHHWELWRVDLPGGGYKQLLGQEPASHQLAFPWETGRSLYVNLTTGRVRELV